MLIADKKVKLILHLELEIPRLHWNDNKDKIVFADRNLASIFGAYRIRRVTESVLHGLKRVFLSPRIETFGGAVYLHLEDAHK